MTSTVGLSDLRFRVVREDFADAVALLARLACQLLPAKLANDRALEVVARLGESLLDRLDQLGEGRGGHSGRDLEGRIESAAPVRSPVAG